MGLFAWEEGFQKTWQWISEDQEGHIQSKAPRSEDYYWSNQFRQALKGQVKRGMVRHTCLVLDASLYAADKDWYPSRYDACLPMVRAFVLEYFDQNPISQLGFVITRDAIAECLSEMSGNAEAHLARLKPNLDLRGDPSLQNALLVARSQLQALHGRASKEVLVLYSGTASCDPGDIQGTLEQYRREGIRVSMISLSAELHICQRICRETQGTFAVALNEEHFKDLLMACTTPFPLSGGKTSWKLVRMGFPRQVHLALPVLCACHQVPVLRGYQCPQCEAHVCHLPTDCVLCGLTLVSSPHLARSYHHLFPLPDFIRFPGPEGPSDRASCCACTEPLTVRTSPMVAQCPKCLQCFCEDCDVFIHDALHSCPGCLRTP